MTKSSEIIIRPAVDSDVAAISEVVSITFGRDDESLLVTALTVSGDTAGSFIAEQDGTIIGHLLFSRLDAPLAALALGPVSVQPGHQRRGVGSALIKHGLDWARQNNWTAVFVLGEPAYYERFGFSAEAARPFECVYSGPYLMAKFLNPTDTTSGSLRYADPFAALS